jgi:predicted GNAT family acetyltransferase
MDYQIVNNTEQNRFEINLGDSLAFVVYRLEGNQMAFLHTEVPAQHGGKGIAAILAKHVLDYAKAQNLQPLVLCPYIKVFVKRHPEYAV